MAKKSGKVKMPQPPRGEDREYVERIKVAANTCHRKIFSKEAWLMRRKVPEKRWMLMR